MMRGRRTRKALLLVPAATVSVLVSACGVTGVDTVAGQNPAGGAGSGSTTLQQPPEFGKEPHQMLSATESRQVGWFVADAGGFALYRYDKDTAKPPKSNCDAECVAMWPPVLVSDHTMTSGVDPTLVGSVARADGKKQVTLAGWPLYRYAGDKKAGEVTGQGKGGAWFAVTPEGKKAQANDGAAPGQPSTGDGY
ncbi:putative lipoprotein with Yx(FWY)xxD motif [Saccharothrix saharensis]|uniref:Putative lipoprotein with Yx(FWY)xxD motif n=2 Tax=Saccharothrix saharensis TaxID=571190 RepID=A0A543J807_9PSEU|nr:putative lipoprotein with Yx(FWY)xxD motif [Saccharothrix saharensis]